MRKLGSLVLLVAISLSLASADSAQLCKVSSNASYVPADIPTEDKQLLQAALNLEYLEAEFFLWSALGYGLDKIRPDLAAGGPSPKGAQKANLDSYTRNVTAQFGYQEVGHVRAIRATLGEDAFPRPQLDLSQQTWAAVFDKAFRVKLEPPFNPYANSINYVLACYLIPYVGLTGYVGANPNLQSPTSKRLVAGLLGVESGQDAEIRGYLYEHANLRVKPYAFTVAEVTEKLSALRNSLDHADGVDDEGLIVPLCLGAEEKVEGNVLAGDEYSLSYARTPEQVLQVVYGTGNASCPGSFFPKGGNGTIAKSYLSSTDASCYNYY